MHACTRTRARARTRLRDSNKGARTRRCNLMDERIHCWYCWPAGGLLDRYRVALRREISNDLVVLKVSGLSAFKKKEVTSFRLPCIYTTVPLTKYLKIVRPFVSKKRQYGRTPSRVAGCYRACIFKNRDYLSTYKELDC